MQVGAKERPQFLNRRKSRAGRNARREIPDYGAVPKLMLALAAIDVAAWFSAPTPVLKLAV